MSSIAKKMVFQKSPTLENGQPALNIYSNKKPSRGNTMNCNLIIMSLTWVEVRNLKRIEITSYPKCPKLKLTYQYKNSFEVSPNKKTLNLEKYHQKNLLENFNK